MSARDRRPGAADSGGGADRAAGGAAGEGAAGDDDRLWERVTRSVKPLARKGRLPEAAAASPSSTTEKETAPEKTAATERGAASRAAAGKGSGAASDAASGAGRGRVDISGLRIGAQDRPAAPGASGVRPGSERFGHGLSHGDAPGVDRRTATRFRRGLMPIDATLDLHGHTRESGRAALTGFLRAHRAAGRRCVLVVTGKGLKDDWSVGALRQALPGWLNTPDLRRQILAYCQAQPRHGGSGAVYILLKRARGGGDDG